LASVRLMLFALTVESVAPRGRAVMVRVTVQSTAQAIVQARVRTHHHFS
jgi:hypothetical protein